MAKPRRREGTWRVQWTERYRHWNSDKSRRNTTHTEGELEVWKMQPDGSWEQEDLA